MEAMMGNGGPFTEEECRPWCSQSLNYQGSLNSRQNMSCPSA